MLIERKVDRQTVDYGGPLYVSGHIDITLNHIRRL